MGNLEGLSPESLVELRRIAQALKSEGSEGLFTALGMSEIDELLILAAKT